MRQMARGYARLRERNQLTLPAAVIEQIGLKMGDIVEFAANGEGTFELRPARIVTVGTQEASREERTAKEEIEQGRYSVIQSVDDFRKHVDRLRKGQMPAESSEKLETTHLTDAQRHDVEAVVQTILTKLLSGLVDSKSATRKYEESPVERRQVRSEAGESV
jgi:bifunctional DNA-binding transcriptional regulator/antitoxin component of YhaV-PrlF toxin-antitoxin module